MYNETYKAYQIFILGVRRIIARINVKFIEEKAYRRFKYF